MTTNGSKIVIDADNGKVDAANAKTQAGFQKTAKEAAKVGGQIDKWGRQMVDKMAGLGGILGMIRAIGQEVDKQQAQAAGANRSRGGGALGRSASVRALGLDKGPSGAGGIDAIMDGSGRATSVGQDDDFLAALAAQQKTSKKKMNPQQAMQALSLFGSGAFSQEELVEAAGKGGVGKMMGQAGERIGAMSPAAREELEFRRQERTNASQIQGLTADRGRRARLSEGQDALLTAQSPVLGGFRNIVKDYSGGLVDMLESEAVVGKGGSAQLRNSDAILQQIANNTKPQVRPTMATTPEGGP